MTLKNRLRYIRTEYADRLALIKGQEKITYAQLSDMVTKCKNSLPPIHIPILIQVSCRLKAILLMLTAIENDIPFIPVDSDKSDTAVAEIKKNFTTLLIISDLSLEAGQCLFQIEQQQPGDSPLNISNFDDVMSIMFTSGSTGKPKGVLVPSSAVKNLLSPPQFISIAADEIFATYSSLSFDASTFEIFTPLLNGNSLVILDKMDVIDSVSLADKVSMYHITCMWMTAGLFNQQVKMGCFSGIGALKKLIVGGDQVDLEAALLYLNNNHYSELYNGYGPTENTIFTTVATLDKQQLTENRRVQIGKLVPGVEYSIRDDKSFSEIKYGSGRLFVKGKGLSKGYLNNPTETDKAFVIFDDGERWYDTGDYVEREATGIFYFSGRKDRQVKLNGHRVELGDIEQRLQQESTFKKVLCMMVAGELIAVIDNQSQDIDEKYITQSAKQRLNTYEIPKHFLLSNYWPLTKNNKLDIKAINLWVETQLSTTPKLINNIENYSVHSIAENILKHRINDKTRGLFEIGFDSINIIKLQNDINKKMNVRLGIMDIYSATTLDALEKIVNESS